MAGRMEMQRALEQRLDAAHEQCLRWQQCALAEDTHMGEAEAPRRFWQTVRALGIHLLDAPD